MKANKQIMIRKVLIYTLTGVLTLGLATACKTKKKAAESQDAQKERTETVQNEPTKAAEEQAVDAETGASDNAPHPTRPQRVPAYRGVITRVQPDGDTLHVFLRGDEWDHFSMTTDGYEVREDRDGRICYMQYVAGTDRETKEATNRQAHDARKRTAEEKEWLEKNGVKRSTR